MYHSVFPAATLVDKGNIRSILRIVNIGQIYLHNIIFQEYFTMKTDTIDAIFSNEFLQKLFPKERADEFFEALLGDADEGAYDISLAYIGTDGKTISMEIILTERPGHCLACNLTQGLPTVFSRHPIINVTGVVKDINTSLNGFTSCTDWSLGYTQQKGRNLHAIPLTITLGEK